jgi:hypothetical protein
MGHSISADGDDLDFRCPKINTHRLRKLNRQWDLATLSRSFAADSAKNLRNTLLLNRLRRFFVAFLNDTFASD